jgi:hypothetical protein
MATRPDTRPTSAPGDSRNGNFADAYKIHVGPVVDDRPDPSGPRAFSRGNYRAPEPPMGHVAAGDMIMNSLHRASSVNDWTQVPAKITRFND